MTTVIITTGKEVISESEIQKLGLLGFECEIDPEIVGRLSDSSGKLLPLDCEILLEGNGGEVSAFGSLYVSSIRRVSQAKSILVTRFTCLEGNSAQLITEYLEEGKVTSVKPVTPVVKLRA